MKRLSNILALYSALLAAPALATPTFTVKPLFGSYSVVEGASGTVDFTVKNVGTDDIKIAEVRLIGNRVDLSIGWVSDDNNDAVFNVQIVNGSNCIGKTLSTNGTCVFQETFMTQDLHPELSDHNFGLWKIWNVVVLDSPWNGYSAIGNTMVKVNDVPELAPASGMSALTLLLGSLGLVADRRRRTKSA